MKTKMMTLKDIENELKDLYTEKNIDIARPLWANISKIVDSLKTENFNLQATIRRLRK